MANQSITSSPVCMLWGAGTSAYLGKDLMAQFMRRLLNTTQAAPLLNMLAKTLGYDLERIMDALDTIDEMRAVVGDDYLYHIIDGGHKYSFKDLASQMRAELEREIIQHYRLSDEEADKASKIHGDFLEKVTACLGARVLPLFTTNYDTAIEDALARRTGVVLCDGFVQEGRRYIFNISKTYGMLKPNGPTVTLFKMHGGLDWHFYSKSKYIMKQATPVYRGDDSEYTSVMIFPGEKKVRATMSMALWRFFREYLARTLDNATLLVVCGYSFRDLTVTSLIDSSLHHNKRLKVVVYDPNIAGVTKLLEDNFGSLPKRLEIREGRFEVPEVRQQMLDMIEAAAKQDGELPRPSSSQPA